MGSYSLIQIGINGYAGAPLNGCLNDLTNVAAAIYSHGFNVSRHAKLIEREATGEKMRNLLGEAVMRTGDVTLVNYSGHGTRVDDLNHDERNDKFDQAIVPFDYSRQGLILDDELGAYADRMPDNRRLIYWLDSCYSGAASRAFGLEALVHKAKTAVRLPKSRALPPHLVTAETIQATREARIARPRGAVRAKQIVPASATILYNNERHILIACARKFETAADAYISGKYQGAGTAALLWAWAQVGPLATYENVADEANAWLKNNGYDQRIVMEGRAANLKRPFLT